jgi:hypothetical protein
MSRLAVPAGAALTLALTAATAIPAPSSSPPADPSQRPYLASVAAAEASLRLHETAAARRRAAAAGRRSPGEALTPPRSREAGAIRTSGGRRSGTGAPS